MKKFLFILAGYLALTSAFLIPSCKKEKTTTDRTVKEEFMNVMDLASYGWRLIDNSNPANHASWVQGRKGTDKLGPYGFDAYSYKNNITEYAYAGYLAAGPPTTVSSWLITPPMDIANGDKLIFYTRNERDGYADRLQVRMNTTDDTPEVGITESSTGKFTVQLLDINPMMQLNGYPNYWKRFELVISGLAGKIKGRIAFRYMANADYSNYTNGIGIDAFEYVPK